MLRARYKNVNRDLTEKNQENRSERRRLTGIRKKVENVEDVEKRGNLFCHLFGPARFNLTPLLPPD
jgi:hypothetical protein